MIKQLIYTKTVFAEKVIKSSWCTTLFLVEINYNQDNKAALFGGKDEDFHMVDADMLSEMAVSDQMTVDNK